MALNSLFCADVPLSNYSLTVLGIRPWNQRRPISVAGRIIIIIIFIVWNYSFVSSVRHRGKIMTHRREG